MISFSFFHFDFLMTEMTRMPNMHSESRFVVRYRNKIDIIFSRVVLNANEIKSETSLFAEIEIVTQFDTL